MLSKSIAILWCFRWKKVIALQGHRLQCRVTRLLVDSPSCWQHQRSWRGVVRGWSCVMTLVQCLINKTPRRLNKNGRRDDKKWRRREEYQQLRRLLNHRATCVFTLKTMFFELPCPALTGWFM